MFRAGLVCAVFHARPADLTCKCAHVRVCGERGWTIAAQIKRLFRRRRTGTPRENCSPRPPPEIDVVLVWRLDRWGRYSSIWSSPKKDWRNSVSLSLTEALDSDEARARHGRFIAAAFSVLNVICGPMTARVQFRIWSRISSGAGRNRQNDIATDKNNGLGWVADGVRLAERRCY